MSKPLWIIDCDPGCDDALALALLANSAELPDNSTVEVLTAAGNVGVDSTTGNACRVIAACNKRWPIYRGCNGSMAGEAVPAASVHGRDGLGDVPNNAFNIRPEPHENKISAVQRLVELAQDNAQKFVLVCTGPLTNLATALNLVSEEGQQSFWERCDLCVVMGGAFKVPGNITASAEFNCHFDPIAAHLVLESWRITNKNGRNLQPIHFVPLDVTEVVGIPLHELPSSGGKDETEAGPFLRAMLRKYGLFHARFCKRPSAKGQFGIIDYGEVDYRTQRALGKSGLKKLGAFCYLHDPLAMWVALKSRKDGIQDWWSEEHVSVDTSQGAGRGRIVIHSSGKYGDGPSQLPTLGTKVKWLDPHPKKFTPELRKKFVDDIKVLLGLTQTKP